MDSNAMKFRLGNVDVETYSKKQTTMSPSGSFDLVKFFFQKGAQVTSNKIVVQLPYEIYWTTVTVKIIVVMTSSRSKNIIDYCKVYISQRVMRGVLFRGQCKTWKWRKWQKKVFSFRVCSQRLELFHSLDPGRIFCHHDAPRQEAHTNKLVDCHHSFPLATHTEADTHTHTPPRSTRHTMEPQLDYTETADASDATPDAPLRKKERPDELVPLVNYLGNEVARIKRELDMQDEEAGLEAIEKDTFSFFLLATYPCPFKQDNLWDVEEETSVEKDKLCLPFWWASLVFITQVFVYSVVLSSSSPGFLADIPLGITKTLRVAQVGGGGCWDHHCFVYCLSPATNSSCSVFLLPL